ncbi:MAG: hypothetical protein M9894_33430 [Planctomycetes bacterium]|nr:hypothetical protein [Planctomycetota bacterium]
MRSLLLRQVRLQAVPAAAAVGLGLLMLLLSTLVPERLHAYVVTPAEVAFAVVAIVAPWLLGVSAVAADAQSGGLRFLGAMPLGPGRHLLLRAVVALGGSALVVGAFALPLRLIDEAAFEQVALGQALLVASLAAGALVRQPLAAFVGAPLLLAAPVLAYRELAGALSAPGEFVVGASLVAPAVLALIAWCAFARPAGEPRRLLAGAAAALAAAVALGGAATTAARAAAHARPERRVEWAVQGDVLVRQELEWVDWPAAPYRHRNTFVPLDRLAAARDLDEALAGGWTLDGGFSVTQARGTLLDGWHEGNRRLLDVGARRVTASLSVPGYGLRLRPSWDPALRVDTGARPWLADEPWALDADGAARTFGGAPLVGMPAGARVEAVGGPRLVATVDGARVLVDFARGTSTPLAAPVQAGVGLSPSGRHLVLRTRDGLTLRDLDDGAERFVRPATGEGDLRVVFAPDEARAIVEITEGEAAEALAVDLVTGRVHPLPEQPGGTPWVWSPSGRRAAGWWAWVDLAQDPPAVRPAPAGAPLAFLDEDAVLQLGPAGPTRLSWSSPR